ncbi:DUF1036 domain-containing protein [Roseobacteraceae bacterium NS-SX3]
MPHWGNEIITRCLYGFLVMVELQGAPMRWRHILAAAAAALFLAAAPAWAGLDICNDTSAGHRVAVSYKKADAWVSQGWWDLLPGECATVVSGGLTQRFYYFHAESAGWRFRHDGIRFCTEAEDFAIAGEGDCSLRGYEPRNFAKIDAGRTGASHRQMLSSHTLPGRRAAAALPDPGAWGEPFTSEVTFQGCRRAGGAFGTVCSFVAEGTKYQVSSGGRTPARIFTFLSVLPPGTPLTVKGYLTEVFGSTSRIDLRDVVTRPLNRLDLVLQQLQGQWYSIQNPADQFAVAGAERFNTYAGVETSNDFISVQDSCGGSGGGGGPYLFTWDSQGGTGLCYRIESISTQALALRYLPAGAVLEYRRRN